MTTILQLFFLLLPFQIALSPAARIDLAIVRIIAPALFLLWLATSLLSKRLIIPFQIQTLLLLSFLFLCVFSLLFAENSEWGLRKLLFLASFFPLYFVIANTLDSPEKIQKLLRYLVVGAAAIAFISLVQFALQFIIPLPSLFFFWTRSLLPLFLGDAFAQSVAEYPSLLVNIGGHTLMRASGFFPDPHIMAFYMGITLPIAIGLAITAKQYKHWWMVSALCILFADLLTFSRGGYLGLIAGMLFVFFSQYPRFSSRSKKIFLALALLGVASLFIPHNPIASRLLSSFSFQEGSNQGRLEMWRTASETIVDHPLVGTGLGNYPLAVKPSATYREPIYAHNLFLDIAVETGILNTAIFFLLITTSAVALFKRSRQEPFFLYPCISLIIFTAHSLVETPLYSVHILPLFLLLVSISASGRKNTTAR